MRKYDRMTDEQLINELRSGDQGIMDYIMDKYKSMVRKKARAMFLLGGENEDLIQEGMIGLIKAVRDYDPVLGNSFSSFAELCVSRQMYSAIEASKRKKHLPLNHYISLYEESENHQDGGNKMQLIDTIEPEQENNPEALSEEDRESIDRALGRYYGAQMKQGIDVAKRNVEDFMNRLPSFIEGFMDAFDSSDSDTTAVE